MENGIISVITHTGKSIGVLPETAEILGLEFGNSVSKQMQLQIISHNLAVVQSKMMVAQVSPNGH